MIKRPISFLLLLGGACLGAGFLATQVSAAVKPVQKSLPRVASCSALARTIKSVQPTAKDSSYFRGGMPGLMPMATLESAAPTAAGNAPSAVPEGGDYSTTNIQVQGVDEADIVKINGMYSYHLSKGRLLISRVEPTLPPVLVSNTDFGSDLHPQELYLDGNRLVMLGTRYANDIYPMADAKMSSGVGRAIWYPGRTLTVAEIWDVSNPAKPARVRKLEFDGSMNTSRLVGGNVYIVMNSGTPWNYLYPAASTNLVPAYRDSKAGKAFTPMARCADVNIVNPEPSAQFVTVAAFGTNGQGEVGRSVLLGSSETVYATPNALYVVRTKQAQSAWTGIRAPSRMEEQTIIDKFALQGRTIKYQAQGTVPGHVLNQFSLDEFEGNLRIATTKGDVWDQQRPSTNNIYVLSSGLTVRGRLENLAPGEKIYSARFMGKRGYLVTFKKVDPLFAIDLSKPEAPKVLGKLKIPGYSDYLHPIDENHLIGIGKNAVEAAEGSFAWYQGMKLAVFDVTDVEHPREQWKTEIGDRGTDSPALQNHKAFFYAPSKQLLALPISLHELTPEEKQNPHRQWNEYGQITFQGVYVYRLTLDRGFELLARLTDHEANDFLSSGDFYYGGMSEKDIDRVQYVGDRLLTFAPGGVHAYHLFSFVDQGRVTYPVSERSGGNERVMW